MQRIFAIIWLTWKAAFRFRLFLVITALLLLAVVGLPLLIKDDGTARGFTQILLTYTLGSITALLGLSTLWLACGTLARDIEECQIQMLAVKPISRWQIWLGKWLGLVTLNVALLAVAGGSVYGLLLWRATKLPAEQQQKLRSEILVARGSAKENSYEAEIEAETSRLLAAQVKKAELSSADVLELARQIREQLKAGLQIVPAGAMRLWQFDLSAVKEQLQGRPLQLRVKFNAAGRPPGGTFTAMWLLGDPESGSSQRLGPQSLAPDTFHEFEIPPDLISPDGILSISFMNPNSETLLFPLDDGMEVLYPQGGFGGNFARGLGIILCWIALLAALGLAAASFLSFPVAAFFSLAILIIGFSSGTLASAVESGTIAGVNEETGLVGSSMLDQVAIPVFKGILSAIKLVREFSPIDSLSSGRVITWSELGQAVLQIVLLMAGFFALFGIYVFSRRELATAQGTQ